MEVILKYIQGNFNKDDDVKEALEELNNFDFNIINPKSPDSIPVKFSVEEIILREEVKNWFVKKTKDNANIHKSYAKILGQCTERLKKELQARKYWEVDIKIQPIGILKTIKEIR